MKPSMSNRPVRPAQKGYALLLVLFLVTLLALGTIAAAPNVITNGQREKEEEMVWRGRQYVRGIRLYYQKTHRFPTQLEDLYKPKTGIRFMRQAYKDPMNPVDGSWRLIYVGPNGQLIGSLKPRLLGPNGQAAQAFGNGSMGAAGNQSSFGNSSFANSSFGNSSFGNSSFGNSSNSSFGNSSFNNSSFGGNNSFGANANSSNQQNPRSAQPGQNPNDPNSQNGFSDMSTPQAIAPSDTGEPPTIIGGNIIGVGSKTNKASFLWFEKARNYRQFEFIWDPSVDSLTGRQIGAPPPNAPLNGASPIGNSPFSSGTPGTNTNMNGGFNSNLNSGSQNQAPDNTPLQAPPQQ